MKNFLTLLLVIAMFFAFTACGGPVAENTNFDTNTSVNSSPKDSTVTEIDKNTTQQTTNSDTVDDPSPSPDTPELSPPTSTPETDNQEITNDQSSQQAAANFALEQSTFKQLYSMAETQYKSQISMQIQPLKNELDDWQEKAEEYSVQKYYEQRNLQERYANMGLLNSGQYTQAMNNLNSKYNRLQGECSANITRLSEQISALQNELRDPDPNQVLAIAAVNAGWTASEAAEKYTKYMQ